MRFLYYGTVPIDNNWVENQIRPWVLGHSNWLFAGSLRSGQCAAAVARYYGQMLAISYQNWRLNERFG